MSSLQENIYLRLPAFLQDAAVSLQGRLINRRRYSPEFFRIYDRSVARLVWSSGQLADYRAFRLTEHLKYARHAPFWKERFALHEVNPNASNPFLELAKLPILLKEEVRPRQADIQNPIFNPDQTVQLHTSGTTGAGLVFRETAESEWERWAVWWRYRAKIGIKFDDLCGFFGGRSVVPLNQSKPPYWRFSPSTRQLIFSAYHLSPQTLPSYLEALRRHRVSWIHGYPSTLGLIASWMQEQNLAPLHDLRFVTTGAENLPLHLRKRISDTLGVTVYEHYGLAESTANITQETSGELFIDEDFSHVELIPVAGSDQCRLVGTNWQNSAFPLFRYDCGDLCQTHGPLTCNGMRSRRIEAIDGRQEDVIVLKNGVKLGRLDHIFKDMVNVREVQIHQYAVGAAVFRVVKGHGYGVNDEQLLRAEIHKRLGMGCDCTVEYVESLPRTRNGKLRMVVSTLASQSTKTS